MTNGVREVVRGVPARDGAGVHLTRVLGRDTVESFDPFLMLDSFDSRDPEDYIKGFPMHPHRGIETLTYLVKGEMEHRDSLGNSGVIRDGGAQWMTAGSGILHEEMPKAAERMLGIQLWINLPSGEKMAEPEYFDITEEMTGVAELENGSVRVVAGEFNGVTGVKPRHLQVTFLDIGLESGSIEIPKKPGETSFLFLLEADVIVDGVNYQEKSALLLGDGDSIKLDASNGPVRALFIQGPPLREGIAWGGPIVMNTPKELQQAYLDLRNNEFIRH